jgi:predicted Rdx family selenoprotein
MAQQNKYKFPDDPELKQLIRDQLAGYKVMNEFVRQEQRRNLPKMTPEESKEIFEGLWMMWEYTRKKYPDYKKLDKLRIKQLIKRRKLWDRISKASVSSHDSTL